MIGDKFRLVTRSDFDGLVCAALLTELDMLDDIAFAHPKDMQDGKVEITGRDITTNLPYVETCHLCFDHHESERYRLDPKPNWILDPDADSAAGVVYKYYGGAERFPNIPPELIAHVDKADSARFEINEILNPEGWVLLNFLMDPRTGLGRFKEFRISNYQLMRELVDAVRTKTIAEIMEMPDVQERVELYHRQQKLFREQVQRRVKIHKNLIELNLLRESPIYAGNRFMIYAMFPETNISMHVMWGKNNQNVVFAVGKSIVNRSSDVNIGVLMAEYGGGGHRAAGTCQIEIAKHQQVKKELIARITEGG